MGRSVHAHGRQVVGVAIEHAVQMRLGRFFLGEPPTMAGTHEIGHEAGGNMNLLLAFAARVLEPHPVAFEHAELIYTSGHRHIGLFHSEHRQLPHMRQFHPTAIADLSPELAEKLGVLEGDWVWSVSYTHLDVYKRQV